MSRYLSALLGTLSLALACHSVSAKTWPDTHKAIQIVVPAPAGAGTADAIARLIAEEMALDLGTSIIVDNHSGANGNIGTALAATARPDGSRLLFSWAGTLAVSPFLYKKLPFDPQRSFKMIGLVAEVPNVLVVSPTLPADSLDSFTDYLRRHPGEVNFASTGNGSSMHLAGELYMSLTHTNMIHIPYSAPGQATTNLISGEIQAMFHLIPGILGQVQNHSVKPLAVTAKQRSPALPEVPTSVEQGYPDLLSSTWFALLAPADTAPEIIEQANASLNRVLSAPDIQEKLISLGATALGGSTEQAEQLLASELEKWAEIVKNAHITAQ